MIHTEQTESSLTLYVQYRKSLIAREKTWNVLNNTKLHLTAPNAFTFDFHCSDFSTNATILDRSDDDDYVTMIIIVWERSSRNRYTFASAWSSMCQNSIYVFKVQQSWLHLCEITFIGYIKGQTRCFMPLVITTFILISNNCCWNYKLIYSNHWTASIPLYQTCCMIFMFSK